MRLALNSPCTLGLLASAALALALALGACSDDSPGQAVDDSGQRSADTSDTADAAPVDTEEPADTQMVASDAADTLPSGPSIAFSAPSGAGLEVALFPVTVVHSDGGLWRAPVTVSVNDAQRFKSDVLPATFHLDSTRFTDSDVTLSAAASLPPEAAMASANLVQGVSVRPWRFEHLNAQRQTFKDGQEIVLDVVVNDDTANVAADFGAIDSRYTLGDEAVEDKGGGRFEIRYTVNAANNRPDGTYAIDVRAQLANWAISNTDLALNLANRPRDNPLSVVDAIFVDGPLPSPTGLASGQAPSVSGNNTLVTGGTLALEVDFTDHQVTTAIKGILVGVDGLAGYYHAPLTFSSGLEKFRLIMRQLRPDEPPPASYAIKVALVDKHGAISPFATQNVAVLRVGAGDLQVSVAWDTPTDVDLHVTGPGGCEVYYGRKSCSSGGALDLDSNPACNIDGINNENVFWDTRQAVDGDFEVELQYWSDCSCCSARYAVSVVHCGEVEVYEGVLYQGSSGSGSPRRHVATIGKSDCGQRIEGHVRYQDRVITAAGFSTRTYAPVRYAAIEVHRTSDDAIVGRGATDHTGRYAFNFTNTQADTAPDVYVRVLSKTGQGDAVRHVEVMDYPYSRAYSMEDSPSLDGSSAAGHTLVVDLDIAEGQGAAPFNVLDALIRAHDHVRRTAGRALGTVRAFWTAEPEHTAQTQYCSKQAYAADLCIERSSVTIQGFDSNNDAWDDTLIAKSLFEFALEKLSANDDAGGPQTIAHVSASKAWVQGASLFLAHAVVGRPDKNAGGSTDGNAGQSSVVVDQRWDGVFVMNDLETPKTPWALGVHGEDGDHSALLVASVLWDLADPTGDEISDPHAGNLRGIQDAIFNYLGAIGFESRGQPGADLRDFLDGFICLGYGSQATVGPILEERGYPYDFALTPTCP